MANSVTLCYNMTDTGFELLEVTASKHSIIHAMQRMQVCMLLSCKTSIIITAALKVVFAMHR